MVRPVARVLRPDVRPVQGRRGAGPDRPGHGRHATSASAWPRPSRRRSSASRRRTLARRAAAAGARRRSASTVTTGRRLFWRQASTLDATAAIGERRGPLPVAATRADETAAILFTSGSTGVAKGAVYTHGIFAAQVEMLRRRSTASSRARSTSATFPLFALFGPALGHDGGHPRHGPDPAGPGRSREDHRRPIERLRRDEPVRLAGPAPPRRPTTAPSTASSCRRCGA